LLLSEVDDKLIWKPNCNCVCSVKSMCSILSSPGQPDSRNSFYGVWKRIGSSKDWNFLLNVYSYYALDLLISLNGLVQWSNNKSIEAPI